MRVLQGLLVATLLAMLVACGVSMPPLPPSLHLPQPVGDLQASRKGDKVTLRWTVPQQSTDGEPLRDRLGVTRICREVGPVKSHLCSQPIAQLERNQLPAAQPDASGRSLPIQATFMDTLSKELQQENPAGQVSYVVETLNTSQRSAGLSNRAAVALVPVAAPPGDVAATVMAEAIELRFSPGGPQPNKPGPDQRAFPASYRVYRRPKMENNFTALGFAQLVNGKMVFEDRGFEWGASYVYKVTPVSRTASGLEIEGEDSQPIEVFTHDAFPPSAPTGLQAVSSGTAQQKFIDLTWAPNTESDLAGYNLYRRQEGGELVRINQALVTTPAFRDSNLEPGRTYLYAVTAVDLRRNESQKSEEASELVTPEGQR